MSNADCLKDIQIITDTLFEPADIVELRFIRGKAPQAEIKKRWTTAAELPGLADQLHTLNRQGWNIYYGPNPRKERGVSGDKNVLMARCLFCDFDNLDPGDGCGRLEFIWTDIFMAGLPEPTIAVHSGHGLHVYWKLTDPITNTEEWKSIQSRLNQRLGADITIKNPERIMRLPGFLNTKKEPFQDCFVCWSPINANV